MARFSKVMDPSESIPPLTELSSVLPNPKDEVANLPIPKKNPIASIPKNQEKSNNTAKEPPQKKSKRPEAKWAIRFTPEKTPLTKEQIVEIKKKKKELQPVKQNLIANMILDDIKSDEKTHKDENKNSVGCPNDSSEDNFSGDNKK